jgi:hypothetical protein
MRFVNDGFSWKWLTKIFNEVPIKTGPCQLRKTCTVQNLNIHYLQGNYDHPHENSYSPIKLVKITLSKYENHEKTWFLESINKKTMKKTTFFQDIPDWMIKSNICMEYVMYSFSI